MPVERAPYLIYSEQVATVSYNTNSGADILAIIAPTRFAELNNGAIKTKEITVNAETGEEISGTPGEGVETETKTVTDWKTPTIKEEEILIFNKYSLASAMVENEELKKVLKDFFLENGYYSQADNLGVNAVMVLPIPATASVNDFINAYKVLRKYRKITAIGCMGISESNIANLAVTLRTYLMEDQQEGQLKIAYIKAPERDVEHNETIGAYATKISNLCQKHTEGTGANAQEKDGANSSRIAFIEPKHYGTLLAKICNTQYYLEPGYLPINSLGVGEFEVLSNEERDKLCMSGLIFGEDDVLLPTAVPRICLGVSSSFGRPYSPTADGYETRPADGLLHARRNVDHHVREVLGILAYQIKRNETSVTIDYIKNQVMSYFEGELGKGTIQAYSFNVVESSYNPYCLLVSGAIVPVNSTLAIEFSNRIEKPYLTASDYV